MAVHKPAWFSDEKVMVSTAPTCGLTKGGRLLPLINPLSGERIQTPDTETGELVDAVNDQLLADMTALRNMGSTETLRFIPAEQVSMNAAVPIYYDRRFEADFLAAMSTEKFSAFTYATLGELLRTGDISIRNGHGSPSADQRVGDVPYIKVSDLRAGLVNINPTNRVPHRIAEKFWKDKDSGLKPFDLLSPERTSKNIGDFCLLMPGQERVLLTKEIIVLRATPEANFDQFYLLWAMTLKIVRDQWKRIVFMQTNREDVGKRFLEILIPVPTTKDVADRVAAPFRNYYTTLADARASLITYLAKSADHHFFVSGAEAPDPDEQALADLDEGENAFAGKGDGDSNT